MKKHIANISEGKSESMLREINKISENAYELFKMEEDIEKIGNLLNESWLIKRNFTPNVSNQNFNQIYEIALKKRSCRGQTHGRRRRGIFLFLAPPQKHAKLRSALRQVNIWVPFKFANMGPHC